MNNKALAVVFSAFLLAAGCSNNEETKTEETKQEKKQVTQDTKKSADTKKEEVKQNKDLTKKVKEEDGVIDGQVYMQDDTAVGTLVLDKKVSKEDAKKLAEKYAKELESTYKDKKINVQAVKDGKNVANITKE